MRTPASCGWLRIHSPASGTRSSPGAPKPWQNTSASRGELTSEGETTTQRSEPKVVWMRSGMRASVVLLRAYSAIAAPVALPFPNLGPPFCIFFVDRSSM